MILGCDLVYAFNTHNILNDSDISIINNALTIPDNLHSINNYNNHDFHNNTENIETKVLAGKVIKASNSKKPKIPKTNKHYKSRHKIQNLNNLETELDYRANHEDDNDESHHLLIDASNPPMDFIENLTYAPANEDSLSIIKGTININQEDKIVYIVTDSGSMTQLIHKRYAEDMGFTIDDLPQSQHFSVAGPGGGRCRVAKRVTLEVTCDMQKCLSSSENYITGESNLELSEPSHQTIKMTFGVVDELPVPILWGGGQMRKRDFLDNHGKKTVSLNLDNGEKWQMPSISWLVACSEMKSLVKNEPDKYKALKPFLPSRDRLAAMVKGERYAYNLPAKLAPKRATVVKISRHQARTDEGFNDVEVLNQTEFYEEWGNKVEIWPSSSTGEAFVVINNLTNIPLYLPAGCLKLSVRPAIAIPTLSEPYTLPDVEDTTTNKSKIPNSARTGLMKSLLATAREKDVAENQNLTRMFNQWENKSREPNFPKWTNVEDDVLKKNKKSPLTFMSWNINSISARMRDPTFMETFLENLSADQPDVMALIEVKLQGDPNDRSKILPGSKDVGVWNNFYEPIKEDYEAYMTLTTRKYSGIIVLVRRHLTPPKVYYNLHDSEEHHVEARFLKLDFKDISVTTVYVPFNGLGDKEKILRRKEWDKEFIKEVQRPGDSIRTRIFMGDFNVALEDSDLYPDAQFWSQQGPQDLDDKGDIGFGGTTLNERTRSKAIIEAGDLVDTYKEHSFSHKWYKSRASSCTFRGRGKLSNRGGRFDYIFVDSTLSISGESELLR